MAADLSVSGLVSGVDWQSMIDKLMAFEQRPIDLLKAQQSRYQRQRQAWLDINTRLQNLADELSALKLESTFLSRTATTSDESRLAAAATPAAASGTYHVTILQLATASQRQGAADIGLPLDPNAPLEQAGFAFAPTSGAFTVNGKQYTIDAATDSLNDIAGRLAADGITLSYDAVNDTLTLSGGGALSLGSAADTSNFLQVTRLATTLVPGNSSVSVSGLGTVDLGAPLSQARLRTSLAASTGSFEINGVAIDVDANVDSLQDVIDRINRSAAGVQASYDPYKDQLILTSGQTGSRDIVLGSDSLGFFDATGLAGSTVQLGQNARYVIDEINGGNPLSSMSNEVGDALPGVTLELKQADPGSRLTLTIGGDVDKAVDAIQAFVDQYNSVQDFIGRQLDVGDPSNPNDGGDLAGNPTLARLQASLRRQVSASLAEVAGRYHSLAEIGITTSEDRTARLEIDEGKLRTALAEHPAEVFALFFSETNVAAAQSGASVTSSSEYGASYPTASVIDGITTSGAWGSGQGWSDATAGSFPDTLTIRFDRLRTIERVVVYTLDSPAYPAAAYGIRDFTVDLSRAGASQHSEPVSGNTSGTVTVFFPSTTADQLTLSVDASNDGQFSRVIEVQAFEENGLAALLERSLDGYIRSGDGTIAGLTEGLQSSIDDLNEQIDAINRRVEQERERMMRQFTALEVTLGQMQTQSAWLAMQIAGLQANSAAMSASS